jgi:hypothetical protein
LIINRSSICTHNKLPQYIWLPITIGKSYEVVDELDNGYFIKNDNGYDDFYPMECFITLEEYRSLQIDNILW